MTEKLHSVPKLKTISDRLPLIFPEGTKNRRYLTGDLCAKVIFVMLYADAIYGKDKWIRPSQVYNMTDTQSQKLADEERIEWTEKSVRPGSFKNVTDPWYANNTREGIRDDVIRKSLIPVGAVRIREGVPTTSSKPRYALAPGFAALFDEKLTKATLLQEIENWQKDNLTPEALAKIEIVRKGAALTKKSDNIIVRLPNDEARKMSPGPSSVICKHVIENFTKNFLVRPALLLLSESGRKIVARDEDLAAAIGLKIDIGKDLPDIILADLEPDVPILIFVEAVATDGPVTEERKQALTAIATEAGFHKENIVFLTAFQDKDSSVYRRLSSNIAWGTLVWFASEPENLVIMKSKKSINISNLREYLR